MDDEALVMFFDKPHFIVRLSETLLKVDLKDGVRKKLEGFVESNPHLRESLGILFQSMIPLDVPLKNIENVSLDKKGQVKIVIPHRRDLTIPLEKDESQKLVDKLNELIPIEKSKESERILTSQGVERQSSEERAESTFAADESERTR